MDSHDTNTSDHVRPDRLAPSLHWFHLVALGVGAIVGTGILTLIGVGAGKAGPAVVVSFVFAGLVCACAALAYAEMATAIPQAGGAYTYARVMLGERIAWLVGWSLILEYSLVVSAVAVGWSGYAAPLLHEMWDVPMRWMQAPDAGGALNLPAVAIIAAVAAALVYGTRESATFNALLVGLKLIALLLFVVLAAREFDPHNLQPFMPFGFAKQTGADGVERGVMVAAAIIFFAFYGFDAIATAAEEAHYPERDLAIGIVGSMLVCVAIYLAVALAALGALNYSRFAASPEPLALVLRELGQPLAARFLGLSAVVALPTVILAFFYGQSRIFYALARDGLLPAALAKISRHGTPAAATAFTALLVGAIAGTFPLAEIAALANAGTLLAFSAVAASMLVARHRLPPQPGRFRAPLAWLTGPLAVLGCAYLFVSLPGQTQAYFLIWNAVGGLVYWIGIAANRRRS
ncbi:amino acid permease [Methylomonas koyamae]|uniref:Amino acid permease n=1 Tax=Methylomonas koyamae TaxID=702114 RepID=A0A177N3J7_9GAMM|nr:amino acid permease [Methylomonas koyamae]OAI12234.1 amino acid permease [Methylomonas koyamae]